MNFLRQSFRTLSSDAHTDRQRDKLRVVTSGHVTNMAVTPLDRPYPKTPYTRKPDVSIFYRTEVMGARIGILDVFGSCNLITFIY